MLQGKRPKWLHNILEARDLIQHAARAYALAGYESDRLLRSAMGQNFKIIGEALNRPHKTDQATVARVPQHPALISFRNVPIHGYDNVDHWRVWAMIQTDAPRLRMEIERRLSEAEQQQHQELGANATRE